MTTQEDRLAALEQKVADIELERLYEKNQASRGLASDQLYDAKQVNYRLTMLLGIASGQEQSIKTIVQDVSEVKQNINDLHMRFASLEQTINDRFKAQDERFDRLEKLLLDRLPPA
ncbi:hypothetical protein [Dictyobacter arantiisoli]|uniref:Uncharacterized protein n=1 Tax=Dictyobacter arantiisoli TaxID=2014874 RepID=A0A5A5T9A9_9CHLR|nr:hypothetical protein [Dictyobacter arantiisoli]GCF08081.1 hypothetical protein KDI_16450 [Dictyobacter arantiisoli]